MLSFKPLKQSRVFMFYTGLSACYYDVFFQFDQDELSFYHEQLKNVQGPALELGVGTGRIMLELMKLGHQVEGVDCSQEMLTLCKNKAMRQGLEPVLYQQNIQALALEKKYKCIYSPVGTFQQLADRQDAWQLLKRCSERLLPDGTFILYAYLPWLNAPECGIWHAHDPVILPDDKVLRVYEKAVHDPHEQQLFMNYRYELWHNTTLLEQQQKEYIIRWYSRYELEDMLKAVGFKTIRVQAGYQDQGPFDVMLFVACN